jgi:hypothetical protein
MLNVKWSLIDQNAVNRVLRGDNNKIPFSVKLDALYFVKNYQNEYFDMRSEYNKIISKLFSKPAELIYFIRYITQQGIMISYGKVPEFRYLVHAYSSLVKAARCDIYNIKVKVI